MQYKTFKGGNEFIAFSFYGVYTLISIAAAKDLSPSSDLEKSSYLPHNLDAEVALLSALLYDNNSYEKVSEFLKSEHFLDPVHAHIYGTLSKVIEKGQTADPITLKAFFEQDPLLKNAGGRDLLAQLAGSFISLINMEEYGKLIRDLAMKRHLIQLGNEIVQDAMAGDVELNALQQIERAEQRLYAMSSTGQSEKNFFAFSQALTESIRLAEIAYKSDSHVIGVTTGLRDLDRWLGGLHSSDLIILAGRPSMGKTALATNIAFNAANAYLKKDKSGGIVAFFSLEMSAEQLATRILASESGISSDKIRRGEIKESDFPKFVEVSQHLANLPLYIDDTPALSISAVRTRARRLKRKHGLNLIVIDYLQLLQAPPDSRKTDGRVQEISEITRLLKALAKELNVPVIALSQLSRAVEQRDDKRPQLADLRESGSIEQDADVVMFVFREEYYEARREPPPGSEKYREWQERMAQVYRMGEVIIAKQRHGPVGTIKLFYDGPLTKFGNYVDDTHLPRPSN